MAYGEAYDFKDARQRAGDLWDDLAYRQTLCVTDKHIAVLYDDGTVKAMPLVKSGNFLGQCNVTGWQDMITVCAGSRYTVGLRANGTLAVAGNWNDGLYGTSSWQNIVSVSAGERHLAALCADGTVAAAGANQAGQCNVSDWSNIVSICGGNAHTVRLRADGTVVAAGDNSAGQCDVQNWTNVACVAAGGDVTIALTRDGQFLCTYECEKSAVYEKRSGRLSG